MANKSFILAGAIIVAGVVAYKFGMPLLQNIQSNNQEKTAPIGQPLDTASMESVLKAHNVAGISGFRGEFSVTKDGNTTSILGINFTTTPASFSEGGTILLNRNGTEVTLKGGMIKGVSSMSEGNETHTVILPYTAEGISVEIIFETVKVGEEFKVAEESKARLIELDGNKYGLIAESFIVIRQTAQPQAVDP